MYSVVIVGAGLIGSSAAKWAAELCNKKGEKVCLVGAKEPNRKQEGKLFGAWFDAGRITDILDESENWRLLAEKSIARYRDIEEKSGIKFYSEVGFVTLVDDKYAEKEELEEASRTVINSGYQCDRVDFTNAESKFPLLNITEDLFGYHQPDHSGHINPRELIKAQQSLAASNNCDIICEEVTDIKKDDTNFLLTLSNGKTLSADKIILAQGAYLNWSKLLKNFFKMEVDLQLTTQTIAYLRVSDEEANRLKSLPTIVTTYQRGALDGTYILPPILYPDGKFYLKLGHHDNFERKIETAEEMLEWYRGGEGDKEAVAELAQFLQSFIKDLTVEEVTGGCCVTSNTPTKAAPFIQEVAEDLVVAAGGCGYAAMSSDEIGRIAAVLAVEGRWDTDVDQEEMKVVWRNVN
eukprot:GFUD01026703.1.p1 GENE.GFUD01026703.1~~GFUD01026703.1.p1  ORF type:complete len:407 (+),score=122.84 GFUD01026703.1:198-1418(+)